MHAPTPRAPSGPPGAIDIGLLLLLGAIWGASFMFIKLAVETVPAMPTTVLRLLITVVIMFGLMWWFSARLPPWGRVWWFVVLSAVVGNVVPFFLIAWGEEHVDGALAAILMSPSPLIAAALAHVFTSDEKLNAAKLWGIALGIVGVAILMGIDTLTRLGEDGVRQLAVIGAGVGYAINSVVSRGLTGGSAVGNISAVMVVSLLIWVPLSLTAPSAWSFDPSPTSLMAIAALALFSTAIGTLLMLNIVRRQGAAFTSQVNFLVPLFGVLWGALILAERPSLRAFIGLALILFGVAVARRGSGLRPAGKAMAATDRARL